MISKVIFLLAKGGRVKCEERDGLEDGSPLALVQASLDVGARFRVV